MINIKPEFKNQNYLINKMIFLIQNLIRIFGEKYKNINYGTNWTDISNYGMYSSFFNNFGNAKTYGILMFGNLHDLCIQLFFTFLFFLNWFELWTKNHHAVAFYQTRPYSNPGLLTISSVSSNQIVKIKSDLWL